MRLGMVLTLVFGMVAQWAAAQSAQDVVFVQIEARPTQAQASERAAIYAGSLQDVQAFSMTTGWFAVALGPYTRSDAQQVLRVYRSEGVVPRDSFVAEPSSFGQQIFPLGADVLSQGVAPQPEPIVPAQESQPAISLDTQPTTQTTQAPDETPTQARRGESLLSSDERKALQTALQWAGYYNAAIDGAFGRGTRGSMADWQQDNGFEPTGVLTTRQRAVLIGQYNAVLEGLGLQRVSDRQAGIDINLPTSIVKFEKYEAPFAHYSASGDIEATVLLISQRGDRATLASLYDIMQTLEIVPLNGARERNRDSFVLIGRNAQIVSETRVFLDDGVIKGFTLVWPAADEERRTRLMAEMRNSFATTSAVLDPSAGTDAQSIDLISGLQIRKPRLSRSGFFVDETGVVVTTSEAVNSCTRITLDDEFEANIAAQDQTTGIAVLRPVVRLAPPAVAEMAQTPPRLQSDVAVSGYSFEGVLGAPSMTFGTLSDLKGLRGEDALARLSLKHLPGDAGGPVIDENGNVLGMLLPRDTTGAQLPANVSFVLNSRSLIDALNGLGINVRQAAESIAIAPQDITIKGTQMTVLVSCWD